MRVCRVKNLLLIKRQYTAHLVWFKILKFIDNEFEYVGQRHAFSYKRMMGKLFGNPTEFKNINIGISLKMF